MSHIVVSSANCPLRSGSGPCECDLPRCPVCKYTKHDAAFQMDHDRCTGEIPDIAPRTYLGASVDVAYDGYGRVELRQEHSDRPHDVVHMNGLVLRELYLWLEETGELAKIVEWVEKHTIEVPKVEGPQTRTTTQMATAFVERSVTICSLFDALIDDEHRSCSPYTPDSGSPRPAREALIAELRVAFRGYAEDIITEYESKGSDMRTALKYEPEDVS